MSEVGPNLSGMQQLADFVQDLIIMLFTEAELRAAVNSMLIRSWTKSASCCMPEVELGQAAEA